MNKKIITLLKYLIGSVVAFSIFFLTIGLRNIYTTTDTKQVFRFLSDGFFIPGILLIGLYLLIWFANLGSFDGIGYAMKHLVSMLIPFGQKKHETYSQYLESKKKVNGFGFLFIIGASFLLIGIVFMILFFV